MEYAFLNYLFFENYYRLGTNFRFVQFICVSIVSISMPQRTNVEFGHRMETNRFLVITDNCMWYNGQSIIPHLLCHHLE